MDTQYNIYEKIEFLEKELISLKMRLEKYESIPNHDNQKKNNEVEDRGGFYTIYDILRIFKISRQTFYLYRTLVTLKKSARIGRFDQFKKENVEEFIIKIGELKEKQPHLFAFKIKRAS